MSRDLDDAEYAAFAWCRFRRILRWMALVSTIAAVVAVAVLWYTAGPLPIHMVLATLIGVGLSVLLAAALMGLMFLSSGTGHDETVDRFDADRRTGPRHDRPE